MKRSYLNKRTRIKRKTRLRQRSPKGEIIKQCEDIIRVELKEERGNKCEICGRPQEVLPYPLSLFHILPKGEFPNIRLYKQNILLACWSPQYYIQYCHNIWHHDAVKAKRIIEPKIKALLGNDYRDRLLILNKTAPKLDNHQLSLIYMCLMKGRE